MELPKQPSFEQKGLKGFTFPLKNGNVDIHYVDVSQGHDTYIISKKCIHIYYILEGKGTFDIDGKIEDVSEGSVVEVLPNIEYTYFGNMKLLLMMNPPWFEGNEVIVKNNPRVK